MGNRKRRLTEIEVKNIPSADLIKVKEESDIKQEPVSVELGDVPALSYRNAINVPDSNARDAENDFVCLSLVQPKDEVKKECDEKKEKQPKTNADRGNEAAGQQPPPQNEYNTMQPNIDNDASNIQKQGNRAHGNRPKSHKCDSCGYFTQHKSNLYIHLLVHTGEKPHACDFCPKRFTQKQYLRAHMKAHVEEFLFSCRVCLKGFNENDEKMAHESDCKILRYECYVCKQSFGSNNETMARHMRVHSGEKPFGCKECFKQFKSKSHLNAHKKLHAGPRSFRCSKCHQGFSREEEQNMHEGNCNRQAYQCNICGKSFGSNKTDLSRHMRSHTGEKPFQCKECTKQFTLKGTLKTHMKIHAKKLPFECLICHDGFSNDLKRKAHQINCNRRNYECYLCKKFFRASIESLKGHMHVHSGVKLFQCELCRNAYIWKKGLKRHMKRTHNKEL